MKLNTTQPESIPDGDSGPGTMLKVNSELDRWELKYQNIMLPLPSSPAPAVTTSAHTCTRTHAHISPSEILYLIKTHFFNCMVLVLFSGWKHFPPHSIAFVWLQFSLILFFHSCHVTALVPVFFNKNLYTLTYLKHLMRSLVK